MHHLTDIPGIEESSLELLEAAGFLDCESLARAGVSQLTSEMERANGILKIAEHPPTMEQVGQLIRSARDIIGEENTAPAEEVTMPVNFEMLPSVDEMLEGAPCAIPFPGRWLAESDITVSEIQPGILLNRCKGDIEIRIEDQAATIHDSPKVSLNQYVHVAGKPDSSKPRIDLAKLKTIDQVAPLQKADLPATAPKSTLVDAMDLLSVEEDASSKNGYNKPRRGIRGVPHSDPWAIRLGAIVTLGMLVTITLAVVAAPLLLLSDRNPESFHWVRPWWIIFPLLTPAMAFFWLVWGCSCSCRICRQRLFMPKTHRKNKKAHHIPLVGYIIPLILHLLIFQWFRCTHCGTPVRLKK
jgi:hypothetical protein